ncbi:Gfo/Idh/MocA family protein [Stieleria varia]|uniref:Inositol 2-dehydrogenase n=1 Tax=Stieleria varia TaxID=2528005 RepID=A0A5C6B3P8_9BACT|nr:Gfo/Idh/MocA family oxidoreductase [Stieleria varia]TWU05896.1 Inositol 2-dehydrogenase [Stieleria varia]
MNRELDRRLFLKAGVAMSSLGLATSAQSSSAEDTKPVAPNDKITLGIMGVNGRGAAIAKGMLATGQVEIAYICDVDERARGRVGEFVRDGQTPSPELVGDFRKILDDKRVDAFVCSAPNHWHAPATILGCAADKHVYVEKPCSHTPHEGELAVAAARKANKIVQMGTQRRSWRGIISAIDKIHQGKIGTVHYARTWYNNRRGPIGTGKQTDPPQWLDWELWQGPCTRQPFKDNVLHYNWHWHWHWGNGELGNNGVHGLDVARWGMQVQYPTRVTAGGGKYRHEDDQETPDTMMVTYDFPGGKTITWEGLSWSPLGPHDTGFGISFHGTEGSIVVRGNGHVELDMRGKEIETVDDRGGDADHFADFLDAVRTARLPNADIQKAHESTLLCHLGNIAYRTQSDLKLDPNNGHILNNPAAEAFWTKEYAPGWEPV